MISTKEDSNELVDRGGARERVTSLERSVDTESSVSIGDHVREILGGPPADSQQDDAVHKLTDLVRSL